jgi:hypothetical protein
MMNIKHRPQFDVEKITAHYTKKDEYPVHYVCTTALDESNKILDIYYRDTPHPVWNTHYLGLYEHKDGTMMIVKADSVEKYNFGMISDNATEEWMYSQSVQDECKTDTGFISGGRQYIRRGWFDGVQDYIVYKVVDGKFVTEEVG